MTAYPTYQVLEQKDGTYKVVVTRSAKVLPGIVSEFATKAEAEAWIARQRVRATAKRISDHSN
jgi:hypothetical protein